MSFFPNVEHIQTLLNQHHRAVQLTLTSTTEALTNSLDQEDIDSPSAQFFDDLDTGVEFLKLCDKHYEMLGHMLSENLRIIAEERSSINALLVSAAELTGDSNDWSESMNNIVDLGNVRKLKIVDDKS